jgi:hypothetical protein
MFLGGSAVNYSRIFVSSPVVLEPNHRKKRGMTVTASFSYSYHPGVLLCQQRTFMRRSNIVVTSQLAGIPNMRPFNNRLGTASHTHTHTHTQADSQHIFIRHSVIQSSRRLITRGFN